MKKLIFTLCLGAIAITGVAQNEPYKNPDLSPEQRAEDLLGRLTLEEKVRLMQNESFSVERLGIAHYDWWNEALEFRRVLFRSYHQKWKPFPLQWEWLPLLMISW